MERAMGRMPNAYEWWRCMNAFAMDGRQTPLNASEAPCMTNICTGFGLFPPTILPLLSREGAGNNKRSGVPLQSAHHAFLLACILALLCPFLQILRCELLLRAWPHLTTSAPGLILAAADWYILVQACSHSTLTICIYRRSHAVHCIKLRNPVPLNVYILYTTAAA